MPDQAQRLRELAWQSRPADAGRVACRIAAVPPPGRPAPVPAQLGPAPPVAAAPPRARTVAVTSGKGGVGKTCVVVNLGVALAELGHRVVVVDLDLGLANVDVITDLRVRHSLYHVLVGQRSLREVAVPGPGGILVVPGASGISQLADLADVHRRGLIGRLAELEALADYILIDTAAGISRNVIGFAQAADEVLVVTSPEPAAITDAYATIKTICRCPEHGDLGLIVNMAANPVEAQRVSRRIASVARQFLSVYVAVPGYILQDEYVREAVRRRRPFVSAFPKAPASVCVQALARAVGRAPDRREPGRGFFTRLVEVLAGRRGRRAAG